MTNRKIKITLICIACLLVIAIPFAITGCKDADSSELKAEITAQTAEKNDLTGQKEDLIRGMEKELESAKTDEEKEAIKEKYESKISKVEEKIEKVESDISKNEERFETALKEEAKKPSKSEVKNDNNQNKPSVKPDNKQETPKKESGKTEPSKPANKQENKPAVKPDTKPETQKPAVKPDTSKKPEQNNQTNEKPKKQVWVIDKPAVPAWDEKVTVMEKEWVTKYVCNGKYFDDYDSGYDYFTECSLKGIMCGGLYPIDMEIEVPVTKIIHHPEIPAEGHYDYV